MKSLICMIFKKMSMILMLCLTPPPNSNWQNPESV